MSRFMIHDYSGAVEALSPLAARLDATPLLAYAYDESLIQIDYDKGMERLIRLEKANPYIAVIHLAIGRGYASHERYADAEVELREALRLKPEDTDAQYVLATVLFALHRPEEATSLLQTLTTAAANQKDPELYHRIGKLQLVNGEVKPAIASLQQAAQLSPKDEGIHNDLAAALHRDAQP
jgi:Flp pilus assembly protein TadD